MTTALIVFLNLFFAGLVLVTIPGLLAWSIVSDRTITASIVSQRAGLRTALQRGALRPTAPARGQPRRGLDLGA